MAGIRFQQLTPACSVFDLEDRFARERGVRGKHPRPFGSIKYWILGRIVDSVRTDFDVPYLLLTVRSPSGYDLFFDRVKQAETIVSRMVFEAGIYALKIEAQFYQTREYEIPIPQCDAAHSIDLEPGYTYPFPTANLSHGGGATLLRGTVHATDGSGVAGVAIEVSGGSNVYLTDETGQWVLIFVEDQPSGEVTVSFTWPDSTVVDVPAVPIVEGRERSLAQAGLRGWVMTEAGVGIAAATVRVDGYPGETVSAHDGSWFYYFGLNQGADVVNVTAQLPDGATLTQTNVQVQPRAIVVVPNFRFA